MADTVEVEPEVYEPTLVDIIVVRVMLVRAGLVADLIDNIFDHAEYWAHSTSQATLDENIRAHYAPNQLSEEYHNKKFLLRSYPVGFMRPPQGAATIRYRKKAIDPLPLTQECDREYFKNLVPYPIPPLDAPARKVVFRIRSHDQGWTTHSTPGAFHDAATWFDVGIEKFDANHFCASCIDTSSKELSLCKLRTVQPPPVRRKSSSNGTDEYEFELRERFNKWEIQRNRVAQHDWTDYEVTWTYKDNIPHDSLVGEDLFNQGKNPKGYDGEFVRSLRLGDVITVWGRSVQAGWENFIESVQIDVYWAL
ncbi:hypothetical protein PT974_05546 [Cladobotryum mycophilum]|uniref:Uncharacterized protein n=1 Tax=Cladobotryum mycophilum TaxID=491253 RepID=A0ABR0SJY3_9HYPO